MCAPFTCRWPHEPGITWRLTLLEMYKTSIIGRTSPRATLSRDHHRRRNTRNRCLEVRFIYGAGALPRQIDLTEASEIVPVDWTWFPQQLVPFMFIISTYWPPIGLVLQKVLRPSKRSSNGTWKQFYAFRPKECTPINLLCSLLPGLWVLRTEYPIPSTRTPFQSNGDNR